jgi:chorismate lyase
MPLSRLSFAPQACWAFTIRYCSYALHALLPQVLLWSEGVPDAPLVYATSWWNADEVDRYLQDRSKPIWVSLSQGHIELYREIHSLRCGRNEQLEQYFKCDGPLWARQYFFWHDNRPLTLIYEVFSNRLQDYLGPPHVSNC